jgi:glutamate formiminotransferase
MVRAIAREIRAASGGLKGVKAMGVLAHGRAQLTMNITDFEVTPISLVYRTVSAPGPAPQGRARRGRGHRPDSRGGL